MVQQGGGRYAEDHRCPGEPATQEIIEHALHHLAKLDDDLPPQSLRVTLRTIPPPRATTLSPSHHRICAHRVVARRYGGGSTGGTACSAELRRARSSRGAPR